ncbi:hypothetical protein BGZ65_000158, partial [Modicella reniformis]
MAIIKPFKVSRAPFLRDVSFFAGCVVFTFFAVADGRITLLESVLLALYYIFYVAFVVIGNWWHQRAKSARELEERARNLYDDSDDDDDSHGEDSPLLDEERALLTAAPSRRGSKPPNIVTQLVAGPYDEYEDEEHDDGYMTPERGDVQDSISLRPPGTPAFKRRPSLISAMEFNDVVRSLTLSGSRGRIASYDPSYYGPKSPKSPRHRRHSSTRTSSSNPALGRGSRSHSPVSIASTSHDGYLTPRGEDDMAALTSPVGDYEYHPNTQLEQTFLHHSLILPDHHDPANQHLGHIHHQAPDQASSGTQGPLTKTQKFPGLLKAIKSIYFPTLLDWNEKSAFVKFLAVTSIPMVLLLTLTLPVVELRDEDEESTDDQNEDDTNLPPKITIDNDADHGTEYDGWSRTATTIQMVIAPIFIAFVVTSILQAFGMIFGVSDAILGLTIFAMGNSLGDLVANITIARMGFPRMAFSACFGGPLL